MRELHGSTMRHETIVVPSKRVGARASTGDRQHGSPRVAGQSSRTSKTNDRGLNVGDAPLQIVEALAKLGFERIHLVVERLDHTDDLVDWILIHRD